MCPFDCSYHYQFCSEWDSGKPCWLLEQLNIPLQARLEAFYLEYEGKSRYQSLQVQCQHLLQGQLLLNLTWNFSFPSLLTFWPLRPLMSLQENSWLQQRDLLDLLFLSWVALASLCSEHLDFVSTLWPICHLQSQKLIQHLKFEFVSYIFWLTSFSACSCGHWRSINVWFWL